MIQQLKRLLKRNPFSSKSQTYYPYKSSPIVDSTNPKRKDATAKLESDYFQLIESLTQNPENIQILKCLTEIGLTHYGLVQSSRSHRFEIPSNFEKIADTMKSGVDSTSYHSALMVETMRHLYNETIQFCGSTSTNFSTLPFPPLDQPPNLKTALTSPIRSSTNISQSYWVVNTDADNQWHVTCSKPPTLREIAGHALRNTVRAQTADEKAGLALGIFLTNVFKLVRKLPYENSLKPSEAVKWQLTQDLKDCLQKPSSYPEDNVDSELTSPHPTLSANSVSTRKVRSKKVKKPSSVSF